MSQVWDWATLALILAGALMGGFVNGLTGFGTALTGLPMWLQAVEPLIAAQLASACSVLGHLTTLPTDLACRRLAPVGSHADCGADRRAHRDVGTAADTPQYVQDGHRRDPDGLLLVHAVRGRPGPACRRGTRCGGCRGVRRRHSRRHRRPVRRAADHLRVAQGLAQGRAAHLLPGLQSDAAHGHAGGKRGARTGRDAVPDGACRRRSRHAGGLVGRACASTGGSTTGVSTAWFCSCCCCRGSVSSGPAAEMASYLRSLCAQDRNSGSGSVPTDAENSRAVGDACAVELGRPGVAGQWL